MSALPLSARTSAATLLAALATLAACAPGDARRADAAIPNTPIAQARSRPDQSEVAVLGVVTVPSGVMEHGFTLQDGSGGIFVRADSPQVAVGMQVRVAGKLGDEHGLRTLVASQVEPRGSAEEQLATPLSTGQVGEANEGTLVEVSGRVLAPVQEDAPYGFKLRIDDGSGALQLFLPSGGGDFGPERLQPGMQLRVTGLSAQYDAVHEVILRGPADLALLP
jgi:hypothetical protein